MLAVRFAPFVYFPEITRDVRVVVFDIRQIIMHVLLASEKCNFYLRD